MLVDIFSRRYEQIDIRDSFDDRDRRLLVQAFRILSEDIAPYYQGGKESEYGVKFWRKLHDQLSRELGLKELSPTAYAYKHVLNGNEHFISGTHTLVSVCETWMGSLPSGSPDRHIKERLSLIELGFRQREHELKARATTPQSDLVGSKPQTPPSLISRTPRPATRPDSASKALLRQFQKEAEIEFRSNIDELNARFGQADLALNYHNGFIQISADDLLQREVETPFWRLVSGPKWANVDYDMKEALDRRDANGRDPAWYAARSLESVIKIISDEQGWTHGGEKGALNYVENLGAKKNGFIESWEAEVLKMYFKHVRNPLGHGPGGAEMPTLSTDQTDWALEFAMSWIKTLIRRF